MNLRVRGISYHISKWQEKDNLPYLVLLHGFLGSNKQFRHLLPRLKTFCNPVGIDLMGHGETKGSELHYQFSSDEQVAQLYQLLSTLFEAPFYLHGYSMGGRLALQFALNHQDMLKGLLLESTTFGIEDEQERQVRQSLDAERADAISNNFHQFLDEWEQLPLFNQGEESSSSTSAAIRQIQESQNPLWMANSLLGFGTGSMPCVKNKLERLNIPVLLMAGQQDQKFVRIANQMKKLISSAHLTIINQAGHRTHIEAPEGFTEAAENFITKQEKP